ncbi:class I SAM-dependent methyltransferase [Geochorda subterranea]|uniref:Class I SAM-dependent methyltransferase n=1 Tax=Geochorda subterranea TaxID=3109564 RepID=A0ABZ1BT45_9FIRM|nr:class I SAM-dependent methyltransferase [Limnochorda sp. LNt]WRP15738.1 class I SAM-dependent methyltransferase [Limnochorda sp. LNt]
MGAPYPEPLYRDWRHYDLQNAGLHEDIDYFRHQVRRWGGPVLELACGTGRIAIPLARDGHRVVGLDLSESMLDGARRKAAQAGVDVTWVRADMREFDLPGQRFRTILLGFNSICLLLTWRDLERMLRCVRRHLADGGRFLIDVFNPDFRFLMRDPAARFAWGRYPDPDGAGEVELAESNRYDDAAQINHITLHYRLPDGSELAERLDMRMYFPQELDALLHYNGFRIEAKYGDYSRAPFGPGAERQLLVCAADSLDDEKDLRVV